MKGMQPCTSLDSKAEIRHPTRKDLPLESYMRDISLLIPGESSRVEEKEEPEKVERSAYGASMKEAQPASIFQPGGFLAGGILESTGTDNFMTSEKGRGKKGRKLKGEED